MKDPIRIRASQPSPAAQDAEVVERKGLGHPDTLADTIAEELSNGYSRWCKEQFGAVLHHNVDKLLIAGGHWRSDLRSCAFVRPITVVFGGRMSTSFGGQPIDAEAIREDTARRVLANSLPRLDVSREVQFVHLTSDHSKYETWFRPRGIGDLPEYQRPTASDTMVSTAWWPLTPTEGLLFELERCVRQGGSRREHSGALGVDVKLMAVREQDELEIVMNVPILSGAVLSEAGYRSVVDDLQRDLERTAQEFLSDSLRIHISLNTSTGNPFAAKQQYVLGIGSCVECGDEGVVGRGNDAMGLISLMRPRSMEAPFGKNPIYHGGKVYAYYAQEIARSVATQYACHASVMIVARHSDPLQDPWQVIIQVDHSQADRIAIATCARAVLERFDHVPALIDGYLVPSLERT